MKISTYGHGKIGVRGKKALILKVIKEGPKNTQELYAFVGARTESQKANVRKVLSYLKHRGLIVKVPRTSCWAITEKGMRVVECIEIIEEIEGRGAPGGI